MPVHEFECDNCGFVSEKFFRVIPKVDPISIRRVCKNCKFDATHKKLMSFNNFHLRGDGWANDNYSKESK
jgi:predicted nucleic acid-binding Zn ribbon protein